jgi:hypothetical protein
MGFYINPPDQTKEEFLYDHGFRLRPEELPSSFDFANSIHLPVCLVDNGAFTAAGIAYCQAEYERFLDGADRPKKWYLVSKANLKPYYSPSLGGSL